MPAQANGVIADRIGIFARPTHQFLGAWNELPGDRIVGIVAVDQRGDVSVTAPIARGDLFQIGQVGRRRKPVRDQSGGLAQGDCLSSACPAHASPRRRRPHHLIDPERAARQHHQPVEAERDAACIRHLFHRGEEILIDG